MSLTSSHFSMSSPSRHFPLLIRNFRNLQSLNPTPSNDQKCAQLCTEIASILQSTAIQTSKEELYRIAEDLHVQKYTPLLVHLETLITNYLNDKLIELQQSKELLPDLIQFWETFRNNIKIIKNIFLYHNRAFKCNSIENISFILFANTIVYNPVVRKEIIWQILEEIKKERLTQSGNKGLLKASSEMLNFLEIYDDIFTEAFFESTREFYNNEQIQQMDTVTYLHYVEEKILLEKKQVSEYLHKSIEPKLLEIIYSELIDKHLTGMLQKGLPHLIEENMLEELHLAHHLCTKINDQTKNLLREFQKYVATKTEKICNETNTKNLIQELLEFHTKMESIMVVIGAQNNESLRYGFENTLKNTQKPMAQLLAKFFDSKLREKHLTDTILEPLIQQALKLFKYIPAKDIFGAFYKRHLAKRLLLNKSTNHDAETSVILKLKTECGPQFTSNIENMFQDIDLSRTLNQSFRLKIKTSDFSVNILTSSVWPNFQNYELQLPQELSLLQHNFQAYYLHKHSGRKLHWVSSLGFCLVRGIFDCGVKELQVSLTQLVILVVFNSKIEVSLNEFQSLTGLELEELKRTLESLCRARILRRNDEVFEVNKEYNERLFRVKLNQIQLEESMAEELETERNVIVDRQFQIDAAIVRIMKSKRCIRHAVLVKELYKMLDIPVNQSDVKKRIELLIEQEYMERDKNNRSIYLYIA